MDLNALYSKLILAARRNPPSDAVPYAFERRIMARLAPRLCVDLWAVWSRNLWRSALMCSFVCLAVGGWSYVRISHDVSTEAIALAFEKTVFTPMDPSIGEMW